MCHECVCMGLNDIDAVDGTTFVLRVLISVIETDGDQSKSFSVKFPGADVVCVSLERV